MSQAKYFEDLEIGERYISKGRTITETDLVHWVQLIGLTEEMFVNREFAKQTIFGRQIIPAMLTHAMASGLSSHNNPTDGTAIALLGGQYRALAPVFIGDTIKVECEVASKKKTSKSDRGVVNLLYTVINQHGQAVLSFNSSVMVRGRPENVGAEEK